MVETVRSGRIGEVIYVNSRRYRDDSHAVRYPDTDPVLMTLINDIDIAQWVTGSDFHSIVARRSEGVGYRSMTAVSATTVTGMICDLRTAWTFPDGEMPPDRVEVVGDRGSVELIVGAGLDVYAEGRRTSYPAAMADDPLRSEQDHFLACVRDRSLAPALTLSQALVGLTLADAAIDLCGPDRSSSNTKRGYSTTTSAKRPGFRERAEDHRQERRLAEQSLLHRARRGRDERREKNQPRR